MKKLLSLTLLLFILVGCNKNNQQPASPPSNPPPTQSNPALTSQEQQLVGKWKLDSTRYTSTLVILHTDTTFCQLTLTSNFVSPGSTSDLKHGTWGLMCSPNLQTHWNIQNGLLYVAGLYYVILNLTNNSLILRDDNQRRYYLHK